MENNTDFLLALATAGSLNTLIILTLTKWLWNRYRAFTSARDLARRLTRLEQLCREQAEMLRSLKDETAELNDRRAELNDRVTELEERIAEMVREWNQRAASGGAVGVEGMSVGDGDVLLGDTGDE
ncbi:MAG: hypothetical protein Q9219_003959 [cf. Caloplaca sp. 3 TL-2023]